MIRRRGRRGPVLVAPAALSARDEPLRGIEQFGERRLAGPQDVVAAVGWDGLAHARRDSARTTSEAM